MPDPNIELYASGPADNTAEVAFLRRAIAALSASGRPAIVVCQPRLQRCTPDLLVITQGGAWTIDVKTVGGSLHGKRRDRDWRIRIPGISTKRYPNLLEKMKQQREALLDDMREGGKAMGAPLQNLKEHVASVAAVWDRLPPGSDCEREAAEAGRYSVVDGMEAAEALATGSLGPGWSLDVWRRFVTEHLCAARVGTLEELCDAALFDAVRSAEAYRQEFMARFGANRGVFIPHPDFDRDLAGASAMDGAILVHGSSGLGKTAHLEACVLRLAASGAIPVFASAELYDGNLERLLALGIAGYTPFEFSSLLSALPRLTAERRVLVVDAIDAVSDEQRRTLLSQIADQWDRGMWSLLLLSSKSDDPDPDRRLPLRSIAAPAMAGAHRSSVYRAHRRSDVSTPWLESLLEVAADGFAVRVLALSGNDIPEGASLSDAIASYVRAQLPAAQRLVAEHLIRRVASSLETRFAQSMSLGAFDEIAIDVCRREGVGLGLADVVRRSTLFREQGDRIRFAHERLQQFIAAQALVDTAMSDLLPVLCLPRNRGYARYLFGLPSLRSLPLVNLWTILRDDSLVAPLLSGEFGADVRRAAISCVRDFLARYCAHLAENDCTISLVEPEAPGSRPIPVLNPDTAFEPLEPSDALAVRLLRAPTVVRELSEAIADAVLMEEQALLEAARNHAQNERAARQMVRKIIVDERRAAPDSFLLMRLYHREWWAHCDRGLSSALAVLPSRGGTLMEIIALQAKLSERMSSGDSAAALVTWANLIRDAGFKAGRVFERLFPRLGFANWESLVEAHATDPLFKAFLDGLVNEALTVEIIWDDSIIRFATELGILSRESLETQTSRYLEELRSPPSATVGDDPMSGDGAEQRSRALRRLFDRATECDEWEAWQDAWQQLSTAEKQAYARGALPTDGGGFSGSLDNMLVSFLSEEPSLTPADLVGVLRSPPWDTVFFGFGDLAAAQLDLVARWAQRGLKVPDDAFAIPAYTQGDQAAWPVFLSLVHALVRSDPTASEDAHKVFDLLRTDYPLVLPDLIASLLERCGDQRPLGIARTRLLEGFRFELASASAYAAHNLDRLRPLLHRRETDKSRIASVIFELCCSGGAEDRAALDRHIDDPLYGELAIAAIRKNSA